MKISKFLVLFAFVVFFVGVFGIAVAQTTTHTLKDYGLTKDDVKYLPPSVVQNILDARTPSETTDLVKIVIEKFGTKAEKANAGIYLPSTSPLASGLSKDVVNCFDYYHFGSVQTNLTAQGYSFNPGDTITFSGPVTNQNNYPIVNGTLYVKIFKITSIVKNLNGPDVVDQFVAVDNIILSAKGSVPVSFSWKVPSSVTTGNYQIASFFTANKKFNLLGLSFTNDAIGNAFNFRIAGAKSASQNVQFDNSGVAISGKPLSKTGVSMASTAYSFTAYPPRMTVQDVAIISAKINNSTDKDQTVDINWSLYKWDGIDPANLIRTEKAKSTIKSNSSNTVQFNVPENTEPVYYVTGVLTYKDSKSIIDVRFIRPEIDKIKLNFPSITSFPIKNSADSTMFSCLYNSGTSSSVQGGKLVLKITDSIGNTVSQYTYQGAVTGNMMAVKKDFKSKNNLDHFFLSAQLFQSDKLVDQSTTEYDCKKIDPKLCNVSNGLGIFEIIAIIILIVALIYGATIVFSKNKKIKVKR